MIEALPAGALVTADAGFVGYETWKAILDSGRHLLIRVGANVRLLRKLGYVGFAQIYTRFTAVVVQGGGLLCRRALPANRRPYENTKYGIRIGPNPLKSALSCPFLWIRPLIWTIPREVRPIVLLGRFCLTSPGPSRIIAMQAKLTAGCRQSGYELNIDLDRKGRGYAELCSSPTNRD